MALVLKSVATLVFFVFHLINLNESCSAIVTLNLRLNQSAVVTLCALNERLHWIVAHLRVSSIPRCAQVDYIQHGPNIHAS